MISPTITWGIRLALVLVSVASAGLAGYGLLLSANLTLPKSDDHPPLLIYGAPFLLRPGLPVAESGLMDRLHRLGYRPVSDAVRRPGEYRVTGDGMDLYLRAQEDHHVPARLVALTMAQGVVTEIRAGSAGPLETLVSLEPPLISGLRGGARQMREWIPLSRMPARMVETVLAVEDRRFFSHPGIDPIAVGRALWANLTRGGVVQGGSTITQQLAKNLFYSPQRTIGRKLKESVAALVLEWKYRKEEILESYLNEIYLGQAGSVAMYGVGEAAHRYFDKALDDLTIEEMATIAGLIKGPNTYAPTKNLDLATRRRDVVLRRLREDGRLTEEEWKVAVNRPLRVTLPQDVLTDAPYFLDYLLRQVEEGTGMGIPEGAKIYSTLDPWVQEVATDSLHKGLARLEAAFPELKQGEHPLQGAVVVLEPATGHLLAMVGGRDYRVSQFNRAVQARRQAGSLMKPFVYLTAFEAGRDQGRTGHTPATLLLDEPVTFESGAGSWSPQNYDRQFHGQVSLRTALEHSYNVPAVRVAQQVGVPALRSTLAGFGLELQADNLSVALGSASVSLLDITGAYGGLANGGIMTKPLGLYRVTGESGDVLWSLLPDRHQAASPQAAYLVTSLLKGVMDRGTGAKARALGVQGPVAGKTGTTDGYRDAWFVGYTPELVIGVWVGFDDERPLKLTGSQAALPIWSDLARRLIPPTTRDFEMPSGLVQRDVDPRTGQLATSRCPERTPEVFIAGTEPTVYCELHGGGLWERLKQTFGFS
ncbi:PBP1A family penicillin-binding protein [Nitrospira moscoviensis]|uniref:Putative Penicillin-binding protein 1B n=1 Tax=Nitrospira moscoviensis TaxID=42253 RepID=A0A0K2GI04_NITMO|nr:PBP1A family penicillin-binding protein [Nitrospira moscoviensis]ALA60479.1 putative Penicillin-binding protein 1B [Nitrospira moscoviensis]